MDGEAHDFKIDDEVETVDRLIGHVVKIGETGVYEGRPWSLPDRIAVDCPQAPTGRDKPRWYWPRELKHR